MTARDRPEFDLHVRPFELPLEAPLRTARGEITARQGFVTGVERSPTGDDARSGDARRGIGEAAPFPGWTESRDECQAVLDDPPDIGDDRSEPGDHPATRHAISLAYNDAEARNRGISLATHLANRSISSDDGGRDDHRAVANAVPVNATVGDGSVAETVAAAEAALETGFDCVKVKVGARPVAADVDRLRAVRDSVGDGVTLRADANGAWDRTQAERAVDAFAAIDMASVEQPLPAGDLAGHADLRGRGVDVALDETLAGRDEPALREVLEAGAADVVVLKPMALGGPLATVDFALRARRAGIDAVVTTTIDAVVARTAAVHVAAAIPDVRPCGLATGGLLADDLAADPAPVSHGRVLVPDGPGIAGETFDDLVF